MIFLFIFEKGLRSAVGGPDDEVELVLSPSEEDEPFIVTDVGRSSPAGVVFEDLNVPLSGEGVLHLLGDKSRHSHEVISEYVGRLRHQAHHEFLLALSNSRSSLLEIGPYASAEEILPGGGLLQGEEVRDSHCRLGFKGEGLSGKEDDEEIQC